MIELDLSGTTIEELPSSSIEYLSSLKKLDLSNCERFKSLPTSICKLKSLKSLDLRRCWKLEIFPEILEPLEHLESLNLHSTGIQVLPPSISMLHFLRSLNLCFSNLSEIPEEIGLLSSLEILNLLGTRIEGMPVGIKNLSKLTELVISCCKRLKSLPELPFSLEYLNADRCVSLETIANSRDVIKQGLSSGNHVITFRNFVYSGCSKLDLNTQNNIVSEFQLRTLDTSIKCLLPVHGALKKSDCPSIGICFPGNKIPMWFTYQSKGPSINIKLSSDLKSTNFVGLAVCVVLNAEEMWSLYLSSLNLSCETNFKTNCTKSCKFDWDVIDFDLYAPLEGTFKSDNVFMWYKHVNYNNYLDIVEVSFRFRCGFAGNVRSCGVRLLYLQDAEDVLGFTGTGC